MKKFLPLAIVALGLFTMTGSSSAETAVSASLAGVRAYPNPWRSDKHANTSIRFDGMPAESTVKIFTVSGHEVRSLTADSSGGANWDHNNSSGDAVASGVYIYLVIDPHGNETSGKLAIIK